MEISNELIEHICKLARLRFEKGELERFKAQFKRIVEYVEKINELNLDDIEPTSHAIEQSNVFRADEVKKSLKKEQILTNAPNAKGEFIATPRVIEEL